MSTNSKGGLRVLVVDDHADTADALMLLLNRQGHTVTTAGGVEDALAAAAGMDALDVLVADVSLNDGTGCKLLPILRERMGGGPRLGRRRHRSRRRALARGVPARRIQSVPGQARGARAVAGST